MKRRGFLKDTVLTAAALPLARSLVSPRVEAAEAQEPAAPASSAPEIIDTNVHLFGWPYRTLKYADTSKLVAKLKKHRVNQAWAGNFEALLHKNLDLANARLAEECRTRGDGLLRPFGSVNPMWPDWEEDLRRCQESYRMEGVRLYPPYHGYRLSDPEFVKLLQAASERGLIVQIATQLEDERVHHPVIDTPDTDFAPLADALAKVPRARVQLLNTSPITRGSSTQRLIAGTEVTFDISHIESVGAIGKIIQGNAWTSSVRVPADRLLFGSHAPYFPCENALLKMFESPLDLDTMRTIMQGNAKRLLVRA
jgi:predicted TIM-barrel fold metal-dependent hydrolase